MKRSGTQKAWLPRMQTRAELYELIDYDAYADVDSALALSGDRAYMDRQN